MVQPTLRPRAALRVGIDGRAFASRARGVRRYVFELTAAMTALGDAPELVALGVPAGTRLPAGVTGIPDPSARSGNLTWQLIHVPRLAARAGVDLYHAPAYTAPPWIRRPMVLSIHDVSYARRPEWYPYKRDAVRRAFYRHSALAADRLITISSFSRDEIVAAYGVPVERIHVIYPAAAGIFSPAPAGRPADAPLPAPYLIHVGDIHPRRNLGVAIEAVCRARERVPGLRLVLAGPATWDAAAIATLARRGAPDVLQLAPGPSDEDLLRLYRGAAALLYPSRYEGFGLPLVEAMACGVPVIAARSGASPEVVGDAGLLCGPDDGEGFAGAVEAVLTHAGLAAGLRARSIARAATFTWTRAAEETVEVYRACASRKSL